MKQSTKKRIVEWIYRKACKLFKYSPTFQPYIVHEKKVAMIRTNIDMIEREYKMMSEAQIQYTLSAQLLDEINKNGFIKYEVEYPEMNRVRIKATLNVVEK